MPQAQNITAEEIIKLLDLKAHPEEGGFFSEIYRSSGQERVGAFNLRRQF